MQPSPLVVYLRSVAEMPNPYFRFKQFTVFHDRCAMKVGTDGVLLGAWANITSAEAILDIGTGTGLVALMLAQRSPALIDAVEIDAAAWSQARENVLRSPWSDRIQVYHSSLQDYVVSCPRRYDLIVSNPPFFAKAYKAAELSRTLARHSDFLQPLDLLQGAQKLLTEQGKLVLIYPTEEAEIFVEKAELLGFYLQQKLSVKPKSKGVIKRILLELGQQKQPVQETQIALESARHIYTPEFIDLIKDFYLKY